MPHYNRILITGAAGRLGSQLRAGLAPLAQVIRLADREPLGPLAGRAVHHFMRTLKSTQVYSARTYDPGGG